jgi:hypothetical protein
VDENATYTLPPNDGLNIQMQLTLTCRPESDLQLALYEHSRLRWRRDIAAPANSVATSAIVLGSGTTSNERTMRLTSLNAAER